MTWPLRFVTGTIVLLALAAASRTQADPDLWGHLRFGLDVFQTGTLPSDDPYSFTQDRPWVNHEWLSELTMGAAYAWAGVPGLALLKGLLVIAGLWVVWSSLTGIALPVRMAALGIALVGTFPLLQTIRPQLWSFVCLAVLCRVLLAGGNRLWLLPPLFAFWANVHGGWIVGLGLAGLWSGVRAWREPDRRWTFGLVLGTSVAATLLTPYGWTLWQFLTDTVRLGRPRIEEWQPVWRAAPGAAIVWTTGVAGVLWLARRPFQRREATLLVLAVLAVAAFRVARITPLFVEAAIMLLAPALAARWPLKGSAVPKPSPQDAYAGALISVVLVALAAFVSRTSLTCIGVNRTRIPDPEAVAVLEEAPPGRLVSFFNWGQYAIWHLGPDIRVSMDGRRETVYSNRRLAEHDAILAGVSEGLALLEAWQPDYVWLPNEASRARSWLEANGYRVVYDGRLSWVAARANRPLPPPPAVPDRRHTCFPG